MTNYEVINDSRFRLAVHKGEYTRAISLFLRIKFPETADLSTLPKDEIQEAQIWVDNAFFYQKQREKELAKEMR